MSFYPGPDTPAGIHPSAVIHPEAKLGQNVSIGPNVVISRGAQIGDNTAILPNVYVGKFAKIGANCLFHPGVNIGDRVQIGDRCIIHHGASLGADGFSFGTETPDSMERARKEGERGGIEGKNKERRKGRGKKTIKYQQRKTGKM